jgi:hypothetical protein
MKNLQVFTLSVIMLICFVGLAQEKTVTGKVSDVSDCHYRELLL